MRVTVCQMDPRADVIESQLEALRDHVAENASDFVLLPEMGLGEWLAADPNPDPDRWLTAVAEHQRRIAELSSLGAEAVMGTRPIVTTSGSRRNQAFVWTADRDSAAPVREKYYLPDEPGYWEHRWYDRGERSFDTCRVLGARAGVQICTEMWFFEWARHYARSRVDLLCVPRVTPRGSVDKWLAGGQALAVCSGAYSLSSNMAYPAGSQLEPGGLGWVVDPEGEVLAVTDNASQFATVEIDLDFARASKSTYPRYVPE